ncbi:MAG: hypothetical protein ABI405_08355 [Parafilimonas sp.]
MCERINFSKSLCFCFVNIVSIKNGQSPVRGLYSYGLRHTTANATTSTHNCAINFVLNILLRS